MKESLKQFVGFFDSPWSESPSHDPGIDTGKCLFCGKPLTRPVKTVSIMREGDKKSYFYRTHGNCYDSFPEKDVLDYESALIDNL